MAAERFGTGRDAVSTRRPGQIARGICVGAALVPSVVAAEGAVERYSCRIDTVCDALGACAPGAGSIEIALAPLDLSDQGTTFDLSLDGASALARQARTFDPIAWEEDDGTRHWLIPAGPASLLWMTQMQGESLGSTTRFLACTGEGAG